MSDIFDRINEITPLELECAGILERAKSGWVCPKCGNGTGSDGTGMGVIPNTNRFKCFKCQGKGESFSVVDLMKLKYGYKQTEMEKVLEKARDVFKLQDDFVPSMGERKKVATPMTTQATQENKPKKDYSEFYQLVQNQLENFIESQDGKFRGLTYEEWREVGAGIATTADLKAVGENIPAGAKCLIFPFDKSRFYMRSISNNPKVKRGNTGGGKEKIYNPYEIDFARDFYVVEGEIDVISLHAAGFDAVATSGAGEYEKLIAELKKRNVKTARIKIMFDNNDTGVGQQNAEKAVKAFEEAGYMAANFILSPNEKYDANEFLQKDFDGFKSRLVEIDNQAKKFFAQKDGVEVLADVFDNLDEWSEKLQGNLLKWGFPTLDKKLPMLPGCYLLGALPSLGKTAFALNVAANVCEQGAAVLYISYEPTAKQVAVKNLAGYWFRKIWNNPKDNRSTDYVPTATQIMLECYNSRFGFEEMKKVREELKTKRKNFYFFQGRRETARDLISKIKPYTDNGVKFIVVDYLQLIKGTDTTKTAREQIDETIRELQNFQSQNDLVILFISSFNRENYRNYVCLESFKESGGLEYTADGILALQFKYSTGESRADNEEFQKKKQAKPRDMELVSLKNRFGIDFVDEFAYHSAHETFIEKILKEDSPENNNLDWQE